MFLQTELWCCNCAGQFVSVEGLVAVDAFAVDFINSTLINKILHLFNPIKRSHWQQCLWAEPFIISI